MENISNLVEEIWYLSEKGYDYMDHKQYDKANLYFSNAATVARNLLDNGITNQNLIPLIRSLTAMAEDAKMNFMQNHMHVVNGLQNNDSTIILNNFNGNPIINQSSDVNRTSNSNSKAIRKSNKSEKKKSIAKQPSYDDLVFSYQQVEFARNQQIHFPKKNQLAFDIGQLLDDNKSLIWSPEELMNGIVTITGGSGSGKTQCLKLLASELEQHGIPCLIFDLHGDIDIGIDTISLDYFGEYGINPMELTSKSHIDGGPIPHINRLMTQFSYAVKNKFSSTQSSWLRSILVFSYREFGIIQEDPETWDNTPPDFKFLMDVIKRPEEIIKNSGDQEALRALDNITKSTKVAVENRLVSILEHPAFYSKKKVPIEDLKEKSYRILLKPLNTIDMQFLASDTLIRHIFEYFKSIGHVESGDPKLRIFIIIDEVKVFTGFKGKINDPYHILNRIATEARKFGIGMILASQILAHFGRDIRSNAATKLILRTMDNDETKRCAKEMKIPLDKMASITKPGEGFILTSKDRDARHIQLKNFRPSTLDND
ncbi:MAG: ATP-binding protein [Candidatus Heimdallarchaeota archaeon]|nr:ATP-binding protein [Candidatus Heimdallarchaeota archaeon]